MYYLIIRDGPLDNEDIQGPCETLTAAKSAATEFDLNPGRVFTIVELDNRGLARHAARAILPPTELDWK